MVRFLGQEVGLDQAANHIARVGVIKQIAELASVPTDFTRIQQAYYLAKQFNLPEAVEAIVRPAARHAILTALEEKNDYDSVENAARLCQRLQLTDFQKETVLPLFLRSVGGVIANGGKDPSQLQQLRSLADTLGVKELIDDQIKAFLRHYFQTISVDKQSPNKVSQLLDLAKDYQLKEVVPFAMKTVLARDTKGTLRGQAMLFVGELGMREQVSQLEPLLKDTGEVGLHLFDSRVVIHVQVRDVALAVQLVHKGEKLAEYGFPVFQQHKEWTLYETSALCAGFVDDTCRDAAFQKYTAFLAKQKK